MCFNFINTDGEVVSQHVFYKFEGGAREEVLDGHVSTTANTWDYIGLGRVQGAGSWQSIKNSIVNRIEGKQGWILKYTDNEIQEILTHGKGLNLPESELEDIILNGCRPDKSFYKADLISQSNFWNVVRVCP